MIKKEKGDKLPFIPLRGSPALTSRKRCDPINASAVINVLIGGPKTRLGTRSMDTMGQHIINGYPGKGMSYS